MSTPFSSATTPVLLEPGRYRVEIDEAWNLRPLPQGGVLTAAAVRAMEIELAHDEQWPRTLHTTYVAQVGDGPVDVDVEILRRGRSMSHGRAVVHNPDNDAGHVTTAVFGASRRGFSFTDVQPPDVPPPAECSSYRDPAPAEWAEEMRPMPFWKRLVETRGAIGHAPWEDYVSDRAERAMWYRFDDPPMLGDGRLDPLALIVLADTMPGAVSERVGQQGYSWFAPSIDLTVHLLDDCRSPWVLAHNRARFAGDGYASAEMVLWDCGVDGTTPPRLVTYATQLFLFSFPS
jgi:acyl-CoA thioesterase